MLVKVDLRSNASVADVDYNYRLHRRWVGDFLVYGNKRYTPKKKDSLLLQRTIQNLLAGGGIEFIYVGSFQLTFLHSTTLTHAEIEKSIFDAVRQAGMQPVELDCDGCSPERYAGSIPADC